MHEQDASGAAHGAPAPPARWKALAGRLMLAHLVAYPVGFAAAVAAVPAVLYVQGAAITAAEGTPAVHPLVLDAARRQTSDATEARQVALVLQSTLLAALGVMLWVHLLGGAWGLMAARAARRAEPAAGRLRGRALTLFLVGVGLTVAALALGGVAGWLWLLLA